MKLDEQALRRADFCGGIPIRLCDGQEWTFPEPVMDLVYDPVKGIDTEWSIGPGYGAIHDSLCDATTGVEVVRAELALAHALLTRNYDLTVEQFRTLVRFNLKDPAREEMRSAIVEVASGNTPKPSTAGSA